MSNRENELIFEKYSNINEGFFDRAKANVAGAVGSVKGAGQQFAGKVKSTVAGAKGDLRGVYNAKKEVTAGKKVGPVAKVESYKKTASKKIDSLVSEITDDLTKLGIDSSKISTKSNSFKKNLEKALNELIADIKK